MSRDVDTRTVTLVDIPALHRLSDRAIVLDSEIQFTRDMTITNGTLSSLLPQRNVYTLIARSDKRQVVGQFRLEPDGQNAQIIYVAPGLQSHTDDRLWLHVMDAMAREAGKHEAHALIAEVEESAALFETMRTCGFAVYARQQIWRRAPGPHTSAGPAMTLIEPIEADLNHINGFIASVVPNLMRQFCVIDEEPHGWIYQKDERIMAYFEVSEGRQGIFIRPYIHPDLLPEASALFNSVLRRLDSANRLPVYIRVRRFQDWMATALSELAFEPGPSQAVMVKHLMAGVRQTSFEPVRERLRSLVKPAKPPTGPLNSSVDKSRSQPKTIWKDT